LKAEHSENYWFDLKEIKSIASSEYQEAKFIALVNDAEHKSLPFKIHALL